MKKAIILSTLFLLGTISAVATPDTDDPIKHLKKIYQELKKEGKEVKDILEVKNASTESGEAWFNKMVKYMKKSTNTEKQIRFGEVNGKKVVSFRTWQTQSQPDVVCTIEFFTDDLPVKKVKFKK